MFCEKRGKRAERIHIFGVAIDNIDLREAVARALESETPCFIVTPNALMLDAARRSESLRALLGRATLSVPDGMGVLLAARRRGVRLRERVAGVELGEALLGEAAERGWSVYFLGAAEGVAEQAAERMRERYPRLRICGTQHGYFSEEESEAVRERIAAARPAILFVCLGFPRQEAWIDANLERLPSVRIAAGLGGSLDVWAGRVRRAPRFVSRMGLEWAWRMLLEPRRRLSGLPALLRAVVLTDAKGRTRGSFWSRASNKMHTERRRSPTKMNRM